MQHCMNHGVIAHTRFTQPLVLSSALDCCLRSCSLFSLFFLLLLTCINHPLDSIYRRVPRQSVRRAAPGACGGFHRRLQSAAETTSLPATCLKRPVICHFSLQETLSLNAVHSASVAASVLLGLSVMYSAERALVRSSPVDITATALSYNVESGRRYLKRRPSARWWWWWHVAEVKCFAISVPLLIAMFVLQLIREEIRLPGFVNSAGRRGVFSRGCFERALLKKDLAK